MSASPFVTGCPACGTRFRVNAAQAQAAGGRVRCGACLEVFLAREHAVAPVTPPRPPASAGGTAEVRADAAALGEGFDDAPIGSAHPQRSAWPAGTAEPPPSGSDGGHSAGPAPSTAAGGAAEGDAGGSATQDERPATLRFQVLAPQPSSPLQVGEHPERDPARRRRSVLDGDLEPGLSTDQRSQFDVLALDPEDLYAPPRRVGRAIAIAAAGALFVLAQALYFKAQEWASIPSVRPVYEGLCWALGCTVPMYRDPAAMRGTNVVLRAHPERPDLLLVDAQIVNSAPWGQAFPDIRLDLLDASGNIVSSRVFEPSEYRGGELATMPDVPPNRPLQVSLEVYRPRVNVVHFRFELMPAPANR